MTHLLRVAASKMANSRYEIVVYRFTFGQFRIQLVDLDRPDWMVPGEGSIIAEA